jgi:hypothetical protein
MADHDRLCPVTTAGLRRSWCQCALIREVRADEREKAQIAGWHEGFDAAREGCVETWTEHRAKVEALWLTRIVPPERNSYVAAIKDVLDLIDDKQP